MKILVTGAAGFIGYHLCLALVNKGCEVVGLDNINDYYDPQLKFSRLEQLGIIKKNAEIFNLKSNSNLYEQKFSFIRMNIQDRKSLPKLFKEELFDIVCNLAAQAGVRYSLENAETYIDSNIVGFLNILECSRNFTIKHLVYASSSSVYGSNTKIPFETGDKVDHPLSLYAASKKSNELMAHTYSHLFHLPTTGLRFFTVYGPWGRPDMAIFLFTKAILEEKPIQVFNHGNMERDFTYIDDIVEGLSRIITRSVNNRFTSNNFYKIYNIGNSKAVKLYEFITAIEKSTGKTAIKELLPLQSGDVERTWANVDNLIKDYDYRPNTDLNLGVSHFVRWYKEYFKLSC